MDRFERRQVPRARMKLAQRQLLALWGRLIEADLHLPSADAAEIRLQTLEIGDVLLSTFEFGGAPFDIEFRPKPGAEAAMLMVRAIRGGVLQREGEPAQVLPAGQIALAPLDQMIHVSLPQGGRCDVGLVQIAPLRPDAVCLPDGGVASLHHMAFLAGYLLRCAPHPEGRSLRLKEMLLEALGHVIGDLARPLSEAGETPFERFGFLIGANLSRPDLSLAHLASAMEMSPRQLQRLLQTQGVQFRSFLLERRLQQARSLLHAAGEARPRVADLAYRCGFSDPNYFSRVYARRWNAPPSRG